MSFIELTAPTGEKEIINTDEIHKIVPVLFTLDPNKGKVVGSCVHWRCAPGANIYLETTAQIKNKLLTVT